MSPKEAKEVLKDMGCIDEMHLGKFRIVRPPKKGWRDLDVFVMAVKTLGAYSVQGLTDKPPRVRVERGSRLYDLVFGLDE